MTEISLSVIVPAYNEERRLGATLERLAEFLRAQPYQSEIVVVDDGSRDTTLALARAAQQTIANLVVVANEHRGKAVAVRSGIFSATGRYVAFVDADLSTPPSALQPMLERLGAGADIAIGSREAAGARRVDEPLHRHVMGRVFNRLITLLLHLPFRDTQCGCKAFRADVARELFRLSRLYTEASPLLTRSAVTAFDVELLFLALRGSYAVVEIPVEWQYRAGSKVSPLRDSVHLLSDVVKIRWHALRGHYGPLADKPSLALGD